MAGKRIVVLGGGMGGVVAASRLRKLLNKEHTVTLVDRNVWHCFSPSYTWLMCGWRTTNRITRDLRSLGRKGVEFVVGEITEIDLSARVVRLPENELPFDYLVVSLGTEHGIGDIEGLGCAWTNYSLEGAEGLQEELPNFREGRIVVLVSALPSKSPATPYETALLLDYFFWQKRVRDNIEIQVVSPEAQPLPFAGREAGDRIVELMGRRDIVFSPQRQLRTVDEEKRRLNFIDGNETDFDMLISTPVQMAPKVVRDSGLAGGGPWVTVDRDTLAAPAEGVYAIGDLASMTMPGGLLLPKLGELARHQAEVVARNIAAQVEGSAQKWVFAGECTSYIDAGYQKGLQMRSQFFAEPRPQVELAGPSFLWHWARKGYEVQWMRRWF